MNNEQTQKVGEIRQKYAEKIKEKGSEDLGSLIATTQYQDLADPDRVQMIAKTHPQGTEYKEMLIELHEEITEQIEETTTSFDITQYDERQPGVKTTIAMDFVEHLIQNEGIKPVVIDGTTIFYKYKPDTETWEQVEYEMIKKKANKKLAQFWTRHTKSQFKQSLEDHHNYVKWEEMGLDTKEILMKNGEVLDLETFETRSIKKKDYALNGVNAVYKPEAESELLEEFIKKTFPNEEERKALQEFVGFTLMFPSDKYEKALLLLGRSNSGKSTFLKTLKQFYEIANTTKISFPQLGMERAFHVEQLKESVINFDHDMSQRDIKNYSRIKKIISKEALHADPKGEKGYDMESKANFVIASNNAPEDEGAGEAFYNRFITVQAPEKVPPEKQDRNLVQKLTKQKELNWMLSWAIEGLRRLEQNNRFSVERTDYETKKIWTRYGDSVDKFIYDQVDRDLEEGRNIPTTDVYEAYQMWCETEMNDPLTKRKFIARAADHPDMEKKKADAWDGSGRRSCFKNIEIADYQI